MAVAVVVVEMEVVVVVVAVVVAVVVVAVVVAAVVGRSPSQVPRAHVPSSRLLAHSFVHPFLLGPSVSLSPSYTRARLARKRTRSSHSHQHDKSIVRENSWRRIPRVRKSTAAKRAP